MESYATKPEVVIPEIMDFLRAPDVSKEEIDSLLKTVQNKGKKSKPVWQETVDVLDDFFKPFLVDLVDLLQDNRWLFTRENTE